MKLERLCRHEVAALKYDCRIYGVQKVNVPARCVLCGKDLPAIPVNNRAITLSGAFDLGIVRRRQTGFNNPAREDSRRRVRYETLYQFKGTKQ
jgi:hypothetical protein